jgi:hypothetical protein
MSIDWKIHTISISKRWAAPSASITTEEPSSETAEEGELATPPQPETGTRYFLHISFAIQFVLQCVNAGIQHWETPTYFVFIILLHGPVLLFNVWVAQGFQEVMAKRYFQVMETKFDAILSPMGGYVYIQTVVGSTCQQSRHLLFVDTGI